VAVLLLVCCVVMTVFGLWVYCQLADSNLCRSISIMLEDAYRGLRYKIYKYTSTKHVRVS
jgi:hypothetical protein